jgi:hypothetical protein
MAKVVMDDMVIGDPASLLAQLWRFWASFPGIHIAQFPFQVIGNCGVIFRARQQSSQDGNPECELTCGPPSFAGTASAIARWRSGEYDGIMA